MVTTKTYVYKVASNCEIQADVYRLPGDDRRPAILWLHGGALIFGDRHTLAPDQLERYLHAGYTVVSADYRLAPEVKLPAIIEDLQDAYRWLREQGPHLLQIDPQRIAVIGHSAGGYLTLMAGFWLRPRPKALVSFYGYGDIAGIWYSRPDPFYCQQPAVPKEVADQAIGDRVLMGTPFEGHPFLERYRFYLYCRQHGLWPQMVTGHAPDEEPEWFTPFCPLRNVTEAYPPTLLVHGDQDTDVPFEQSVLMSEALERHGVEHQLMAMAGRGHGFDGEGMRDSAVAGVFERVLAFLDRT